MKPIAPTYVGDGVYVQTDPHGALMLTTGHHAHEHAENVIIFEPEVWAELMLIISRANEP